MLAKEVKSSLVKEFGSRFGKGENDTGSAAVQVAILTHRINELKSHFDKHIHDYHSNRGLLKMIGRRKALLRYLQGQNQEKYGEVIKALGLRK